MVDDDLGLDTVGSIDEHEEDLGIGRVADVKDMPESRVSRFKRTFKSGMETVGKAAGSIARKTGEAVAKAKPGVVKAIKGSFEKVKKLPEEAEEFIEEAEEYAEAGGKKLRKLGKTARKIGAASRKVGKAARKGVKLVREGDRLMKKAFTGVDQPMRSRGLSLSDFGLGSGFGANAARVDFGPRFNARPEPERVRAKGKRVERPVRREPVDFGMSHFGNPAVSGIDFGPQFGNYQQVRVKGKRSKKLARGPVVPDVLGASMSLFRRREE